MSEGIYAPPTMPVYVDRLIADTQDLNAEEFGVYWLLCLRQWSKGSIPQDNTRQAHIGRVSPKKMRAIRSAIGARLQPHPTIAGAEYSPFEEDVRCEMEARNKKASDAGKKGAAKRWQTDSNPIGESDSETNSEAIADRCQNDKFQSPISRDQLASLAAGAREGSHASPALDFCFWLLGAGVEAGVIRGHHVLDKFRWASSEITAAETILASPDMGETEARTRAERLFAMKRRGDLRREVNVRTLLAAWDWDEIKGAYALPGQGAPSDVEGL